MPGYRSGHGHTCCSGRRNFGKAAGEEKGGVSRVSRVQGFQGFQWFLVSGREFKVQGFKGSKVQSSIVQIVLSSETRNSETRNS
jgi:hypothetical protein